MVGASAIVVINNASRMKANGNEGGISTMLLLMLLIFFIAGLDLIYEAWKVWNRTK